MTSEDRSSSLESDSTSSILFPFQMTGVRLIKIEAEVCEPTTKEQRDSGRVQIVRDDDLDLHEFDVGVQFETGQIDLDDKAFSLSVVLEGHFRAIVDPETLDEDVVEAFLSLDVVSVLWPYLRETVHDITRRMELPLPPLPIADLRAIHEDAEGHPGNEPA